MFTKIKDFYSTSLGYFYKEFESIEEYNRYKIDANTLGLYVGHPEISINDKLKSYIEETVSKECENPLPSDVYEYKEGTNSLPDRLISIPRRQEFILPDLLHNKAWHEDVLTFLKSKDVYEKYGAMFRRNYLIYGIPGGGKSTQIRDLSYKLVKENNAIVIYTKKMIPNDMLKELGNCPNPKLIVMEEIATGIEEGEYGVSRLLQWLDGEYTMSNTITILTTNYPQNIPENLMRCGRVDKFYEVGALTADDRSKFLAHFLGVKATEEQISSTENMVSSDLKELCLLIQLENLTFSEGLDKLKEKRKLCSKQFKTAKQWLG